MSTEIVIKTDQSLLESGSEGVRHRSQLMKQVRDARFDPLACHVARQTDAGPYS